VAKQKKPRVYVCRGCCCGTRRKHPQSDERALRRIVGRSGLRWRTTDCLGPCGQGNVVVVRAAGTYRWFRKMDGETETRQLVDHLSARGDVEDLDLGRHRMPKRDGRKPKG
jgi:(2Fe-2S) ferredoxin